MVAVDTSRKRLNMLMEKLIREWKQGAENSVEALLRGADRADAKQQLALPAPRSSAASVTGISNLAPFFNCKQFEFPASSLIFKERSALSESEGKMRREVPQQVTFMIYKPEPERNKTLNLRLSLSRKVNRG